ncbi:hypothetical protein N657DRAFT_648402 [Parathielavia appendiculata]|uniref:Uncharacterized protein n=1 Tax=Parathielavia appendiculata TaxID=2587402 RepID=A0AAN6TUK1_9PEZI|nr:hypothetical protein N657DRAFT_648402 [Parathielavia appendiculata]
MIWPRQARVDSPAPRFIRWFENRTSRRTARIFANITAHCCPGPPSLVIAWDPPGRLKHKACGLLQSRSASPTAKWCATHRRSDGPEPRRVVIDERGEVNEQETSPPTRKEVGFLWRFELPANQFLDARLCPFRTGLRSNQLSGRGIRVPCHPC